MEYWSNQFNGGHRFQTEDFLKKEAKEKLFHLNGGESLLDFGCGSADLLAYIAKGYKTVVGADFSRSMLLMARDRLDNFGLNDVLLILADDKTLWNSLSISFDRIIATQVVQYFNMDQLENFLINSSRLIKNDGKIILFDIIDPCLYWSWKYGRGSPSFSNDFLFVLKVLCLSLFDQMHSMIARKPIDLMGYAYHPSVIEAKAEKNGLRMEYVSSMYYEYRYHAILKKYKI